MSFLITKADLPDYTKVSVNVSDLQLNPAIRDAHTFDVLPLLHASEVLALVAYLALSADDKLLPANLATGQLYTTAVRPLLCYEAYRRFLLDHGAHITDNGVENISDIGHQPITTAQRTEMRADAAAKCSHYRAVLASALRTYRGPTAGPATCGTNRRRPGAGGLRTSAI